MQPCKACFKVRQDKYRSNPSVKEANATKSKEWQKANVDKVRHSIANYAKRNNKKLRAKASVYNALRRGELVRPTKCEQCGKAGKIQGHHCDYNKPLDVMWLCVLCHNEWHRLHGEGKNPV